MALGPITDSCFIDCVITPTGMQREWPPQLSRSHPTLCHTCHFSLTGEANYGAASPEVKTCFFCGKRDWSWGYNGELGWGGGLQSLFSVTSCLIKFPCRSQGSERRLLDFQGKENPSGALWGFVNKSNQARKKNLIHK